MCVSLFLFALFSAQNGEAGTDFSHDVLSHSFGEHNNLRFLSVAVGPNDVDVVVALSKKTYKQTKQWVEILKSFY